MAQFEQGFAAATAVAYTTDVAERASIVKEFEWAITEHQAVLAELADRLQPLLRPDPSAQTSGGDPMPPMSDARTRLYDLHQTTANVRYLLDRLEV